MGILGGSFHPIHKGHIAMALSAKKALSLDTVLLMVDRIPPHKQLSEGATDRQRFDMASLAAKEYEGLEACDLELKRKQISYTAHTLQQLRILYPQHTLYFIMGSDMLRSLQSWYQPETVCSLARLVCIRRQGEEGGEERAKEQLEKSYGAHITLLPPVQELSSTKIRRCLQQYEPITEYVPEEVERYIYSNALYMQEPWMGMTNRLRGELSAKRFSHVMGVVKTAITLAKQLGIDGRKARLAALLHDCAKELPVEEQRRYAQRSPRFASMEGEATLHALAGSEYAKEAYGVDEREVLQAIALHTTGDGYMTPLDKLIYVADMIEPGRSFQGVEELREKAVATRCLQQLDSLLSLAISHTICYIEEQNKTLHPASLRARDALRKNTDL